MSQLIITFQETNSCASRCQGKLVTTPVSVWILQVFIPFFNSVTDLLPIMLSTSCHVHRLNTGGLLSHHAPPLQYLLLSFCFYFGWKLCWIISTHFPLIPLEASFKSKRITSLNTLPFSTKLQSHTPVKRGLDKKCDTTSPHSSLSPWHPLSTPFNFCFPPFSPSQIRLS